MASVAVNSIFTYKEFNLAEVNEMRSFSNCKIAAILVHDPECIYLFKLLLSCSVT